MGEGGVWRGGVDGAWGWMRLDREEFAAAMQRMYAGLEAINAHLRELNGRTGKMETRVEVLETRIWTAIGVLGEGWGVVEWVTRR